MDYPLPSAFEPKLTHDLLTNVAAWLLDELHATDDDLVRDTDNNYTRGCTAFMRQRVRILKEAASGRHPWLGVPSPGNDLVFSINGIPCRYSNDDPDNPKKDAVTLANAFQTTFLDFGDDKAPQRFCFVVDRGLPGITDPHVEFLGFTAFGSVACRWISTSIRQLQLVNDDTPAAVPVSKPAISPKRRPVDDVAGERS